MRTFGGDPNGIKRSAFQWRTSSVRPSQVILLWLVYTALCIIDTMLFPSDLSNSAAIVLLSSVIPILSGMVGAWALGLRATTLGLVILLFRIAVSTQLIWMLFEFVSATRTEEPPSPLIIFGVTVSIIAIAICFGYTQRSKKRRASAIALVLCMSIGLPAAGSADRLLWNWTDKAQLLIGKKPSWDKNDVPPSMTPVPVDALWDAQPGLDQKALLGLKSRLPDKENIYALAVAGDGSQQIFAREASMALDVVRSRFGDVYRGGVLLSNHNQDMMHNPLATRTNFMTVAKGIGSSTDSSRDLFIVYLASHGSRNGELSTNLPNYENLSSISSRSVADAFETAHIKRRVIIISACYSASWIPALASADTIIITAAAKDRTSFGCDDSRSLTYFGEAFLKGPFAQGASLQESFEAARRKLARWEAKDQLVPSKPEAYVGTNMQALWKQKVSTR